MNDDILLTEMVNGYRTYAEPTDVGVTAASETPASTPFCGALASFAFSYVTTNGAGGGGGGGGGGFGGGGGRF